MKKLVLALLFPTVLQALSPQEAEKIGRQVFMNEASGHYEKIVYWNPNESFPSLGIGHNLWFPKHIKQPYQDQFPLLCDYLKRHDVVLPAWVEAALPYGAPWDSREEFLQDTERVNQLRTFLSHHMALQTQFMIERVDRELPRLLACIQDPATRERIARYVVWMRSTPAGQYALVDYWNFKGGGFDDQGRPLSRGAGILKVLSDIQDNGNVTQENIVKAFTTSAWIMLGELTRRSNDFEYIRYLKGWSARIYTYITFN